MDKSDSGWTVRLEHGTKDKGDESKLDKRAGDMSEY